MKYLVYYNIHMFEKITKILLIAMMFIILSNSVELMLRQNHPSCTVLISSFQPLKVELIFPEMNARKDEFFKIRLINDKTRTAVDQIMSKDNTTYRNNFYLDSNVVYSLCIQFVTQRPILNPILVGYKSMQSFETEDIKVDIPQQLINETNLEIIFETAKKMRRQIQITTEHQKRQRQLEDKLSGLSLHKAQRIITITTIEIGVILICAAYQILALRSFLKEKNLY